jgi:hypothetical protein
MNNNDLINRLGLMLQLISLIILLQDFNNTDLMKELRNQDNNYLNKIIEQNEKILEYLKKGSE